MQLQYKKHFIRNQEDRFTIYTFHQCGYSIKSRKHNT